jgi:hypothetical protein
MVTLMITKLKSNLLNLNGFHRIISTLVTTLEKSGVFFCPNPDGTEDESEILSGGCRLTYDIYQTNSQQMIPDPHIQISLTSL